MQPNQPNINVGAFLQVVEQQDFVFDEKSRTDLAIIKQTLAELENQPVSIAANAIAAWSQEHPRVRDAVVSLTTRDIKIKPRNPANQEGTLINQFPDYKKIIGDRQNNLPPEPNKK